MPDLVGQTLQSRYRIEALVGRGGMAEVYKAWDTRRQYHVAIKVMREDLAEDIEFLRRFKQEAQALAALSHTNIVRFYSFEREGRLAFIVMDYVAGTTLRGRILDAGASPLPLDEVASIVRQVCSALHYAHEEGLIHRDVKPGNIMIQPDGRVLLSDLGIAKVADSATVTTVMPGTPAYMSPEQCRNEPLGTRTDIYSLGVVVYEMLAGRRPFVGESKEAGTGSTQERIRREQIHSEPPPLHDYNPALPLQVEQVVLKALSKKQEERWPSALAFREALDRALGVTVSEVLAQRPINPPSSLTLQVQEPPTEPRKQLAQDKEAKPRLTPRGLTRQTRGMVAVIAGALVVMLLILALGLGRGGFNTHTVAFRTTQTSTPLPAHTPTPLPPTTIVAITIEAPTKPSTPTATPSSTPMATSTSTPTATPTNTPIDAKTPTWTASLQATATLRPASVNNIWNFRVQEVSASKILVTVDYSYNGDHGNVVWIRAEALGKSQGKWVYDSTGITRGYGTVTIQLECYFSDCDRWTSDQVYFGINLPLNNTNRNAVVKGTEFYTKVFYYRKTWANSSQK